VVHCEEAAIRIWSDKRTKHFPSGKGTNNTRKSEELERWRDGHHKKPRTPNTTTQTSQSVRKEKLRNTLLEGSKIRDDRVALKKSLLFAFVVL
jgi:hypothetical protein